MADTDYPSKLILLAFFVQEQKAGTKDERDEFSQESERPEAPLAGGPSLRIVTRMPRRAS